MSNIPNNLEYINDLAKNDPAELIRRSEARFDNILNDIAERVHKEPGREIVMLAGPSASGKTTTARKLSEKFAALGMQTHVVSLDDFYLNREDIPGFAEGNPDYETVTALDLPLLAATLNHLLTGEETEVPEFDFTVGRRSPEARKIKLGAGDVIIVEGLHALNPEVTKDLPGENLLKIYISVSSRIYNTAGKIVLNKRNLRFIRRLVRDYQFRASSVENTYKLWENVRRGEDAYLFPYRRFADLSVNSIHLSAPCLFRDMVIPMLESAELSGEPRQDADRLVRSLKQFVPVSPALLPEDSLLREFLGKTGLKNKD